MTLLVALVVVSASEPTVTYGIFACCTSLCCGHRCRCYGFRDQHAIVIVASTAMRVCSSEMGALVPFCDHTLASSMHSQLGFKGFASSFKVGVKAAWMRNSQRSPSIAHKQSICKRQHLNSAP